MDDNFVLRFGKHSGKTIGWLKQNDRGYLNWATQNAPNMLKPTQKVEPKKIIESGTIVNGRIQPNMNFDNEGPDPILKSKTNDN